MEAVTTLQRLAERVSRGGAIGLEDAPVVAASHDLIAIGMMADDLRRRLHGRAATFVRVFEVHLEAIPAALPAGASAGEIRLVGDPRSLEAACEAVAAARRLAGDRPVSGFSLADLAALAGSTADAYVRLREAGLERVSFVAVDEAGPGATQIAAARNAGLAVDRLVVIEPPADIVDPIRAALDLQQAAGGFRAFAPLPRAISVSSPTTGYDDVKSVALARLLLADVPSIQVDWPLYGPKLAQVALTVGADDVDGVEAVESGLLGARRSALEEIRGNIGAAGLEPVERNGRYERVD